MRTRLTILFAAIFLISSAILAQTQETTTPKPKVGVVSTAHLDTQWRWTIKNTIEEYIPNTLHDNFKLLDLYPDYVFSFEGAFRYMLMKEYYPDDYERLKKYIAGGRWRVTGAWVDACDVNIPSFESLTRHALYGNGFYKREFGKQSYDIFMPDCFGFGYALPSIAMHCGLKSFSTQKLTWGCSVPVPFSIGEWQGVDGSTVITGLKTGNYVAKIKDDLSRDTLWLNMANELGKETGAYLSYMYIGTGDVGGAPESLTVDWLQRSIKSDGPMTVASVGADDLPKLVAEFPNAKLQKYDGELVMTRHGVGCYTSQAAMKRWNRRNEQLADAAERAAVTASLLNGYTYPRETLREAWVRFLWHQFHDDLTGTSIPEAYEYSWSDELLSLNQFANIQTDAISAITPALDTRGKGKTVVVYNPLAIEREEVVEVPVTYGYVSVFGPDSKAVPCATLPAERGRKAMFLAKVPPLSYSVFDIREVKVPAWPVDVFESKASKSGLENGRYKVALNPNGDVTSVFDKLANKELLAAPIEWQLIFNKPRQWPAWEIQYEDLQAGVKELVGGTPKIEVIETSGPVRAAVKITRTHNNSNYETIIRLAAGSAGDRIEFINHVDWAEKETLLKAAFKLNGVNDTVTYDLGLGAIKRGINKKEKYEVPGHMWADQTATDKSYGVSILNDCKYGWDHPDNQTLRLTLIHTPGVFDTWSWVGDQSSQDIGKHDFTFAIAGHTGPVLESDIPWQAARLNQPLQVYEVPQHPGKLGKSHSLLSLTQNGKPTQQVMVNAIKMAETSDEFIIRVRELQGKPAENITINFGRPVVSAREVNGQEEEIGPATSAKDKLTFSLKPFQPKAFAVRLGLPKMMMVQPLVSRPVALPYNLDGISTDANKTDGNIDGSGNSLAGELLPDTLNYRGVNFTFGPKADGAMNVVSCNGQKLDLPAGKWRQAHLLMMATGGPVEAHITPIASGSAAAPYPVSLHEYTEPVGQWENRMVNGRMVDTRDEILPAYVNQTPIAWAGAHRHIADGKNDIYKFTYLYEVTVPTIAGTTQIQLPSDSRLKLLAVSVSDNARDAVFATDELYDQADARFARIAADQTAFIDSTIVALSTPFPGTTIRYAVDGTTPTKSSAVFERPFAVNQTATIMAMPFVKDEPVGPVTKLTFQKLIPREPVVVPKSAPGLQLTYYEGEWTKLPDFTTVTPAKELVADTFIIPSIARPEDYGLVFKGYISVPTDGLYELGLNSDDGSALIIGDSLLIDNDGVHGDGEVPGKIALKAGLHPIELRMFQCKGGQALNLFITGPGLAKQEVGKAMLFHSPTSKKGKR